ncbi:hypothetical protein GQ44DRAFT_820992 [Phaeosphaeriaceae sp. PMI808]|nr:hypothetical protein GQ44DRAFT_820992 [Phaeosphaeriaceae sp. PMI808]
MTDSPGFVALPSITALPPTTARQIGSGQVFSDPSSAVKELIENALDARAKSIFVDISANTIDSIQVKDDGHGIPAEDRILVCRRYCTSKIRNFDDLKNIGGKWLGFRGEALSSMAEMSRTLSITTRVEGESVAVALKYDRNGELSTTERHSHPVGSTVKITHLFDSIPVRKQTTIKSSAKCLAKIRRLVQAYALSRPTIRFRLHVLKAKIKNVDFMYAPTVNSNIVDAALKIFGNECALQCEYTVSENEGFEIHAFLPKPTASGMKISNHCAFISVNSRPMSNNRGTIKKLVKSFHEKLRKVNSSLRTVRDPFFCMNIICPPESYDPNIEPAKDDVIFGCEETVLSAVDRLLSSFYPASAVEVENKEPPPSAQGHQATQCEEIRTCIQTPAPVCYDTTNEISEQNTSERRSEKPRWRSSMYGIDEDDLEFLEEIQAPVIEEEEGIHAVEVSNPWTIARMNATTKHRKDFTNLQLPSPAKSHSEAMRPSSPMLLTTPLRVSQVEPLTPQTSSRMAAKESSTGKDKNDSSHPPHCGPEDGSSTNVIGKSSMPEACHQSNLLSKINYKVSNTGNVKKLQPSSLKVSKHNSVSGQAAPTSNMDLVVSTTPSSPTSRFTQKNQIPPLRKSLIGSSQDLADDWFGQPLRKLRSQQSPRRRRQDEEQEVHLFPRDSSLVSKTVLNRADHISDNNLYSENNTDIRDFFGQKKGGRGVNSRGFTSINEHLAGFSHMSGEVDHRFSRSRGFQLENTTDCFRACNERRGTSLQPLFVRPTSTDLPTPPQHARDGLPFRCDNRSREHSPITTEDFQAYKNRYTLPPIHSPLSKNNESPLPVPKSSDEVNLNGSPSRNPSNMAAYFKAYQDCNTTRPNTSASISSTQTPHIPSSHKSTNESRPQRRRTTDMPHRTKSSMLPLERIPKTQHMHNIILTVKSSISLIVQSARNLNAGRSTLAWEQAPKPYYDVFAEPVSETLVGRWVTVLDEMLHERWGREGSVDVRACFQQGIQRGLSGRKGDGVRIRDERERGEGGVDVDDGDGAKVLRLSVEGESARLDGESNVEEEVNEVSAGSGGGDDMYDDIDDDMLLDL